MAEGQPAFTEGTALSGAELLARSNPPLMFEDLLHVFEFNNQVGWDMSFHTRDSTTTAPTSSWRATPSHKPWTSKAS